MPGNGHGVSNCLSSKYILPLCKCPFLCLFFDDAPVLCSEYANNLESWNTPPFFAKQHALDIVRSSCNIVINHRKT
jgi:hypothetical protein